MVARSSTNRHVLASHEDRADRLIEAIRALAPFVAAHRSSFDQDRQLPDAVFDALAEAGLFRLWLPEALGGVELSPLSFMRVVERAAALDGSIGWLVGNGGGMSRAGGYLPLAVARPIFENPNAFIVAATGAVGTAVVANGGYRLSGRWPFGSGAAHATHFMVLASVTGEDGSRQPPLCCYVTRSDVLIHDTWYVSGLRGTGSSDFEMSDVFVPARHTHPFLTGAASTSGLVYRMPPVSIFAWTVSVVPLGIVRGALDAFADLAGRKSSLAAGKTLRERETVQACVGRAEAQLHAARAFLASAMSELIIATDVGGDMLVEARAVFRTACAHAAEAAVEIMSTISAQAGATAIFEDSPLERAVRDVNAAVKHVAMNANSYVVAGRVHLGLEPGVVRF
jgi:indole-3-acetate monooxygenase